MTTAELIAYNYGQRLARSALEAVDDGAGHLPPKACIMTADEAQALDRLGLDAWWAQVQKGGQDALGGRDAVRPV